MGIFWCSARHYVTVARFHISVTYHLSQFAKCRLGYYGVKIENTRQITWTGLAHILKT